MQATYIDQLNQERIAAYTSETSAISRGYGLVYDYDYGTAADTDKRRGKIVINPSTTENAAFAGVLAQAKGTSTGLQRVDIIPPGQAAMAYCGEAGTIGDLFCCDCGATYTGQFMKAGEHGRRGRGYAILMETIAEAQLAPVMLLTGDDVGLLQRLEPAAAGAAQTLAPYGVILIDGTDVNDADCSATLADGTEQGQMIYIRVTAAIGNSKDFVLTVTNGIQDDNATAIATITFNAKDELTLLEWVGDTWREVYTSGATISAT